MSLEALVIKKQSVVDYFIYHPDSREIVVGDPLAPLATFRGLFDYAYRSDKPDQGNVLQVKRMPHVTFFSEYLTSAPRGTKVTIEGISQEFTLYQIKTDLTEETMQGELWLI